ncbi:MAG: hypothetical protein IPL39_17955 [Opitutaceae bacterium]|nr:hypothetical protein [Opitutaceae bacterium]
MLSPRILLGAGLALSLGSSPLGAIVDRNSDGLSDVWMALYQPAKGATADEDGDGLTNAQEALAGTDPQDAGSRFAAFPPQPDAAGNLVLCWRGAWGKRYTVQSSTDLRTWTALPGTHVGRVQELSTIVRATGAAATEARCYWRVVVADIDTDGDEVTDWEEQTLATDPVLPNLAGPPLAQRRALAGDPGVEAFRPPAAAGGYYVDAVHGDDLAVGTSGAQAWRSLTRLNKAELKPGDVVRLARGSVWNEALVVYATESGTVDAPIVFEAYGRGAAPTIELPADAQAVDFRGSQIVLLDLVVRGAKVGIHMTNGSQGVVVAGNEIIDAGIAISVEGRGHRILSNYIHDLRMIRNTPEPSDDYGAIAVLMMGEDLEAAWNCLVNCRAPSHDFGTDGGAFESWYPGTLRRVRLHHNLADNTDGFMELTNDVDNLLIAHNLFINSPGCLCFHTDDVAGKVFTYQGVRFENNTVVRDPTIAAGAIFTVLSKTLGVPQAGHSLTVRNNVVVSPGRLVYNPRVFGAGLIHDHNLFCCVNNGGPDFSIPLAVTESTSDPRFVAPATLDYRLQAGSPALGWGVAPFFGYDLQGSAIPGEAIPDLGAYERK